MHIINAIMPAGKIEQQKSLVVCNREGILSGDRNIAKFLQSTFDRKLKNVLQHTKIN
jgi:hypothetical protein